MNFRQQEAFETFRQVFKTLAESKIHVAFVDEDIERNCPGKERGLIVQKQLTFIWYFCDQFMIFVSLVIRHADNNFVVAVIILSAGSP